jgi:toxin-antitoxin system PIN domain toxin
MNVVDVNVLINLVNEESAHHVAAKRFWNDAVKDDRPLGLAWVVVLGFVRVMTSPRVFPKPLRVEDAVSLVDDWLALPNVRVLAPTERHWGLLKELLVGFGTAGNSTTDAHLAALAIEHGATLVSGDSDFARFPGLRWKNPFAVARARR